MKYISLITLILTFLSPTCFSQNKDLIRKLPYKEIDTTFLGLTFYYPDNFDSAKIYPAITFFFGGGWNSGNIKQFEHHAQYFSSRGLISILVDYRVNKRHGTTPFDALKDAKSAIRFIRKNADLLNIDPGKIIASGGSAGGHLAAACGNVKKFNEENEDLSVSSKPNALVLFNPAVDNGPGGVGYNRIGEQYHDFSPLHNIHKGAPPTIIFLGTNDKLIPVETAQYYKVIMEKVGSRCDLFLYEEEEHGFFNYNKKRGENYRKTLLEADKFLVSLGYLTGRPTVNN
jgi:acetyl esterase